MGKVLNDMLLIIRKKFLIMSSMKKGGVPLKDAYALILLLTLFGLAACISGCATTNTQGFKPIIVKRAELTKETVPLGTMQIKFSSDRLSAAEFLAPSSVARPKEGEQFVVLHLGVNARSDKQWKELIRSVHLTDSAGKKYRLALWYFKGAYRNRKLLAFAVGLKSTRETRVIYALRDPLSEGLELIIGEQKKATIAELLGRK